jgi:hypothetical protein
LFATDSLLSQTAYTTYPGKTFYTGYGVGYQFGKKWELNYDGRLHLYRSENSTGNESVISKKSDGTISEHNLSHIINKGSGLGINQGFAVKYKIDTIGSEWTSDLSFNYAPSTTSQEFSTSFIKPVRNPFSGDGNLEQASTSFTAQTNLLSKLPKQLIVETGLKSSNIWFNNATEYFYQLRPVERRSAQPVL